MQNLTCPAVPGDDPALNSRTVSTLQQQIIDLGPGKRQDGSDGPGYLSADSVQKINNILRGCAANINEVAYTLTEAIKQIHDFEKKPEFNKAEFTKKSVAEFEKRVATVMKEDSPLRKLEVLGSEFEGAIGIICNPRIYTPTPPLTDKEKADFGNVLPSTTASAQQSKAQIRDAINALPVEQRVQAYEMYLNQADKNIEVVAKAREAMKAAGGAAVEASTAELTGIKNANDYRKEAQALVGLDRNLALSQYSKAFESHPFIVVPPIYKDFIK